MRARSLRRLLPLALSVLPACQDGTAAEAILVVPGPPDLRVAVFQSTHEDFISPAGHVSQHALWIGLPSGTRPDAGLVVGSTTPVFIRENGGLSRTTGAAIMAGDLIEVWRDASVAYGAVQAPPGAPCYRSTQIVIER